MAESPRQRPEAERPEAELPAEPTSDGGRTAGGVALVHRIRPATLVLLGLNVLMLVWLIVSYPGDPARGHGYCDAMSVNGPLCPVPTAHYGITVLVVLLWFFMDAVGGAAWVVTKDRARSARARRYGLPY